MPAVQINTCIHKHESRVYSHIALAQFCNNVCEEFQLRRDWLILLINPQSAECRSTQVCCQKLAPSTLIIETCVWRNLMNMSLGEGRDWCRCNKHTGMRCFYSFLQLLKFYFAESILVLSSADSTITQSWLVQKWFVVCKLGHFHHAFLSECCEMLERVHLKIVSKWLTSI